MNTFVPDIPGVGGRIVRIGAGQISSRVLNKVTNPLRVDLKGKFKINGNAFDSQVQNMARAGVPAFEKIQKSIQALAIHGSPDFYQQDKENKNAEGDYNNNILSTYSLQNYSVEELDSLLGDSDMQLLFSESELSAASPKDIFRVIETKTGLGSHGRGSVDSVAGTFETEAEAQAYKQANSKKPRHKYEVRRSTVAPAPPRAEVERELLQFTEQTGSGALYGFGGTMPSKKDIEDMADFVIEAEQRLRELPDDEMQEILKQRGGKRGINIRYALYQSVMNSNTDVKRLKGMANLLRVIRGDMTDLYGSPIKEWKNMRYKENKSGDFTAKGSPISDEDLKDWDDYMDANAGITEVNHEQEKERRRQRNARRKKPIGSKYDGRQKKMQVDSKEKSPVIKGQNHQSTFSSNPMRHNHVPNREQIKRSIHSLSPDLDDPNTLVTYTVAFGGKTPKSKDADSIRDAFQIEYGGPGTDKLGGLRYRTDAYVFTPSLFMFNALKNTASIFGLDKPSTSKYRLGVNATSLVTKKINAKGSGAARGLIEEDMGITVSGVVASRETRSILKELNARARRTKGAKEALIQDGKLVLDKNQILQTKAVSGELEVINDILNDAIFGGKLMKFASHETRAPFEKVLDVPDLNSALVGNDIAKLLTATDKDIRKGLATYGRKTFKDTELFDDPIVYKKSDFESMLKYEDPDFIKFTENGITTVLGKSVTRKVTPGQATRQGDMASGAFLDADPLMVLGKGSDNLSKFMLGQRDVQLLINSVADAITSNQKLGLASGSMSGQEIRETAAKMVFAMGDEAMLLNPGAAQAVGEYTAAIVHSIKNFGKFYKGKRGGPYNKSAVSDNLLDVGDSTRRQLTEPTFNEMVALLQDDTILNAIRVSFIRTENRILMGRDMGGIEVTEAYRDMRNGFESAYREVMQNVGDAGIQVGYVGSKKPKPAPSGPSAKGADYGPNEKGMITSLGDQVSDINEPGVADIMDEAYRRSALGSSQSSIGLANQLRNNNNNLQTPTNRKNAVNYIIDRIRQGNLQQKSAINLFIDEPKLQLGLKELATGNNVGNISSAPVASNILNGGQIQELLVQILSDLDFTGFSFNPKSDSSPDDEQPDIFENDDF